MISLILLIIAVAICNTVVLQAQSNVESQVADTAFYLADAGIRYATPRVMYRYFMDYGLDADEVIEQNLYMGDPDYTSKLTIEIYAIETISPPEDGYTHKNKFACVGKVYRNTDNLLIGQRVIYADLYMNADFGKVNTTLRKYYEKNR